jgi:hypothetical protein
MLRSERESRMRQKNNFSLHESRRYAASLHSTWTNMYIFLYISPLTEVRNSG